MGIRERPSFRTGLSSWTPDEMVAFRTPFFLWVGSGSGSGVGTGAALRGTTTFFAAGFFLATLRAGFVVFFAAREVDFAGFAGFTAFLTTFFFAIDLHPLYFQ